MAKQLTNQYKRFFSGILRGGVSVRVCTCLGRFCAHFDVLFTEIWPFLTELWPFFSQKLPFLAIFWPFFGPKFGQNCSVRLRPPLKNMKNRVGRSFFGQKGVIKRVLMGQNEHFLILFTQIWALVPEMCPIWGGQGNLIYFKNFQNIFLVFKKWPYFPWPPSEIHITRAPGLKFGWLVAKMFVLTH